MQRGYAPGPYGQVHYNDTGGTGTPLVLLPQAPMTLRQYDSVYDRLHSGGLRAIGIDPPGFGNSDPTSFTPTISDWAAVLPAVLNALSLDRAYVAGHHTGALIAADFAVSSPERVHGLIMHGAVLPTSIEREQRLSQIKSQEQDFEFKKDGSHFTDVFAIRDRLAGGRVSPELLSRYVVEQFVGRGPFWHGHHAAYTYDFESKIFDLPERTLIMSNTGDPLHNQTMRIFEKAPQLRYAEMKGSGVDIIDEQPEQWADIVIDFVRGPD